MNTLGKALILVVEDHPIQSKVCKLILTQFGYLPHCVATASAAIEIFRQTDAFAAVLMDWRLPDLDGLSCANVLRQIDSERGTHTPIIAVTGYVLTGDREKCLAAGMDDYIGKPFSMDHLQRVLDKWLSSGHVLPPSGLLGRAKAALAQNDLITAEILFTQVIAMLEYLFGRNHMLVLEAADGLIAVLERQKRPAEANALRQRSRLILLEN